MRRIAILLVICALAMSAAAQKPAAANAGSSMTATHLIGLGKVPRNVNGTLSIEGDKLVFKGKGGANASSEVAVGAITDVQTADDSKRLIGGVIGTLSMFGPYGSGRFLSLFRKQIDVLTVEYRDANGGLHGAIFTMGDGMAQPLKDKLVAVGAKVEALPALQTREEKK
jgi:hypothetical protein